MKRSLPAQMRHEWKSNIWLVIELFIVLAVIWIPMLFNVMNIHNLMEPKGFDDEDVYALNINYISSESPEFVDMGEATAENNFRDQKALIDRLRANPYVECAAFSNNSLPYTFNYWGNSMGVVGGNDSVGISGNQRFASPEIVRVLRLKSETGKSMDELEKMLREKKVLISKDMYYELMTGKNTANLIGKDLSNDSVNLHRVGDLIQQIKRSEYERNTNGMFLFSIDENLQQGGRYENIVFRVRPGMGKKFQENFNSDISLRQQRNVVLSSLTSLVAMKNIAQRRDATNLRSIIGIMSLFLLIVFLGILGSFWYRVQQRHGEIAMRKVCGASRRQIFSRLLSEGTIILACSALLTVITAVVVLQKFPELLNFGPDAKENQLIFFFSGALSILLMELMILLGIFFPARKAMKVEPAIALKEE